MTLIRRQQASGRPVAPFRAPLSGPSAHTNASDAATPIDAVAIDDRAERAATRILELEDTLSSEREDHKKACETARAEGREEGLKTATARDGERFALLHEAIERASAECAAKIEQRADLAVTIARAALQRVFGTHWHYPGMVDAVIRQDASQLAEETVIRVRVSADDFPDAAALQELAAARGVEIERDAQLGSGSCLFDCTLGTIDASIPIQAQAVDELLERLEPVPGGTV